MSACELLFLCNSCPWVECWNGCLSCAQGDYIVSFTVNRHQYFNGVSGQKFIYTVVDCPPGSAARSNSDFCTACREGQTVMSGDSTSIGYCTNCTQGTYNTVKGGECLLCPAASSTLASGASG